MILDLLQSNTEDEVGKMWLMVDMGQGRQMS